ncbi:MULTISPECIES: GNAT family N-acetyltransferase [Rhizobium/Agrobacterium group]|uniref:Acetyltransferase n=1 Tax=Agrobacterium tumefaciens TaxID=358 RepID=A0AB36EL84_AGRTU|nr:MULTISPECIES: GNAT family N-acetyltransferase [Rhizobium/Agrobacterium group]HCV71399.1 N-acetyltransferase [Agrobacterium sp.]KQY48728.1 acetyltransferase [Rhizobium sp. Root491]MDR5012563.1 GNAT family N-acetyltransferase [Agrobacterium tumefaciens]NSY59927.1 GNAT family N-acetyltransferase [Agrobacterium tumefaciens]OCJ39395.1 acetyltransferase [Agrobacterium tumefaciens]
MIEVRPAKSEELPELAAIGLASWRKGILPLVNAEVASRIESNNPFIPFLKEQGENILVASVDGVLAGLGASEDRDNHISDIWVAPENEGKGVGSALIAALEERFRAAAFAEATISVSADNARALGLYLHLGYHETWRGFAHDPILDTTLEKISLAKAIGSSG